MSYSMFNIFIRELSTNFQRKFNACVVGAGPAGFYTCQHLVKNMLNLNVDILERYPVPYGLVRFGVAPDHPEVKNVINTFANTAERKEVRFVGNVNLGKDIFMKELAEAYDIIILTYGADDSNVLNIPGTDLPNVIHARNVVGWYNGIPSDTNININLNVESVAIIGQGNVAIDIARILLTPVDLLKYTDITQHSLELISSSKVRKVYLIGRRGPMQAAFTIKEFREMLKLHSVDTLMSAEDFNDLPSLTTLSRPRKRLTELMISAVGSEKKFERCFIPKFFRSPSHINGTEMGVESLCLKKNILIGDKNEFEKQCASTTNEEEIIECGMVISSIGYKSVQVDEGILFDTEKGIAKNSNGEIANNMYTSGWLATGPTGVILTTMNNSFTTAAMILEKLKYVSQCTPEKPGFPHINHLLRRRNVQTVSWNDWKKIDAYEIEQGKKSGKPREKIVNINKMLEII